MIKRKLTDRETEEAWLVFKNSLDPLDVIIHEQTRWPDVIGRIGAWLRKEDPPSANAVTLGQHIFFPRRLAIPVGETPVLSQTDAAWLIHELTHVWQYQNLGLCYVLKTVWLHLKSRHNIYRYGGPQELNRRTAQGEGFLSFNAEQQGEITREYYLRLKRNLDLTAWNPYINELQYFNSSDRG
jgi:hypothetical protein